jgi:hypothetical protein
MMGEVRYYASPDALARELPLRIHRVNIMNNSSGSIGFAM